MEAWDIQTRCLLQQSQSAPVFRKKRSQTNQRKGKFVVLETTPKVHKKKKAKQVSPDTAKKSGSIKRRRTRAHELYDGVEAKFSVLEKAERVYTSLAMETPFFLKCMLPSNVTYSFWLIMPKGFCSNHLPSEDSTITLVDEWGKEYKTTYLIDRHGLSAGWRGFSMSHGLLKGDILIFNLIEPCRFMVHIVRVYALDVVNAALCLMNMDAFGTPTKTDLATPDNKKKKRTKKYAETTVLDAPLKQVIVEEICNLALASTSGLTPVDQVEEICNLALASTSGLTPVDQSETCSDSLCSEVLQGAETTDHAVDHHYPTAGFICERPYEGVRCM